MNDTNHGNADHGDTVFRHALYGGVTPPTALRKQDWAYEQMREWIIVGELAPGRVVEQEALASRLGISRIPLREALARLTAEGLLSGRPHQKMSVSLLTIADARDVYTGREALESRLAAGAAEAATPEGLARIGVVLDRQSEMLGRGAPDDFRRLDHEFHHTVYEMAGLPKTLAAAASLFAMSQRYVRLYLSGRGRSSASFHEHSAILEAIRAGDGGLAAALTREHVMRGLASLEVTFASAPPPDPRP